MIAKEEIELLLTSKFDEIKANLPKGITEEQAKAIFDAAVQDLPKGITSEEFTSKLEEHSVKVGREVQELIDKSKTNKEENNMTIADAVKSMFEEKGIKTIEDVKKLAISKEEIEIKADNPLIASSFTGTYALTQSVSPIRFPSTRPTAFIGQGIRTGVVGQGKNILLWTTGSFTGNVAYIGELADATTTVDGSHNAGVEKTRELSGIVGRAVVTSRSLEDLPQLTQRLESNLMESMNLWLDQKVLDGAGNDATKKNEMYGILTGQVTAFDSTSVPKVEKANIGDLADACKLQAKKLYKNVNTVWMSENMAFLLQRTKDATGQYIINKLVDGTMMMNGLKVITTELLGGATEQMIVGDIKAIQLWIKRNLTAEFERVAKTDSYNLYIYARQQVLVEDEDIKSLIYVDDVLTALDEITVTS